jgi:hypothetical protein
MNLMGHQLSFAVRFEVMTVLVTGRTSLMSKCRASLVAVLNSLPWEWMKHYPSDSLVQNVCHRSPPRQPALPHSVVETMGLDSGLVGGTRRQGQLLEEWDWRDSVLVQR